MAKVRWIAGLVAVGVVALLVPWAATPVGAAAPLALRSSVSVTAPTLYVGVRTAAYVAVTNNESGPLDDVVTELVLPPQLAFESAPAGSPCALEAPSTVRCRWGRLAATPISPSVSTASAQIWLIAKKAGTDLPITVRTTSQQGGGESHTQPLSILDQTDLEITSFTDGRTGLHPGERTTYTLGFRNNSPYPITGAHLDVPLPAGATYQGASVSTNPIINPCLLKDEAVIICRPRTLQPGEAATMTFSLDAPASGALAVSARIDVRGPDIDPSDDTATDLDLVGTTRHDLAATLTDQDPSDLPAVGDRRRLVLRVDNLGPDSADGATAVVRVPAGTSIGLVDPPSSCTATARVLTCALGRLQPGGNGTVTFQIVLKQAGPLRVQLTATAGTGTDEDPGNDVATHDLTVLPAGADLGIRFGAREPDVLAVGELEVVTLYPSNFGPSDAPAVLEVTLPPSFDLVSTTLNDLPANASCGTLGVDRVLRCSLGKLIDRGPNSYSGSVSVNVRPNAAGTVRATARISPAAGGPTDPVPENDTATSTDLVVVEATANVLPAAILRTDSTARTPAVLARFENRGPATARDLVFTLSVTPGLRIVGYTAEFRGSSLPGCTMTATQVRCTKTELLERDPVYLSIQTEAVGPGASTETVQAHVTTTSVDPVRNDRRSLTLSLPAA